VIHRMFYTWQQTAPLDYRADERAEKQVSRADAQDANLRTAPVARL
jgi:hypothetical protein